MEHLRIRILGRIGTADSPTAEACRLKVRALADICLTLGWLGVSSGLTTARTGLPFGLCFGGCVDSCDELFDC